VVAAGVAVAAARLSAAGEAARTSGAARRLGAAARLPAPRAGSVERDEPGVDASKRRRQPIVSAGDLGGPT